MKAQGGEGFRMGPEITADWGEAPLRATSPAPTQLIPAWNPGPALQSLFISLPLDF